MDSAEQRDEILSRKMVSFGEFEFPIEQARASADSPAALGRVLARKTTLPLFLQWLQDHVKYLRLKANHE